MRYTVTYFYRITSDTILSSEPDYEERIYDGEPEPEKMIVDENVCYFSIKTKEPLEHEKGPGRFAEYETFYFLNATIGNFYEALEKFDPESETFFRQNIQEMIAVNYSVTGEGRDETPETIPYIIDDNYIPFPFLANCVILTPLEAPDAEGRHWEKTTTMHLALGLVRR
jgi:hypothetical protein